MTKLSYRQKRIRVATRILHKLYRWLEKDLSRDEKMLTEDINYYEEYLDRIDISI